MAEGGFGARLRQELGKRPVSNPNEQTPANGEMGMKLEDRVSVMSEEQMQERWAQLMDRQASGALSPDEDREAQLLEVRVAAMRRRRSAGQAA